MSLFEHDSEPDTTNDKTSKGGDQTGTASKDNTPKIVAWLAASYGHGHNGVASQGSSPNGTASNGTTMPEQDTPNAEHQNGNPAKRKAPNGTGEKYTVSEYRVWRPAAPGSKGLDSHVSKGNVSNGMMRDGMAPKQTSA